MRSQAITPLNYNRSNLQHKYITKQRQLIHQIDKCFGECTYLTPYPFLAPVPVAVCPSTSELDAKGIAPFAVKTGRSLRLLGGDMGAIAAMSVVSACVLATHCKVADACGSDTFDGAAKLGAVPKLSVV